MGREDENEDLYDYMFLTDDEEEDDANSVSSSNSIKEEENIRPRVENASEEESTIRPRVSNRPRHNLRSGLFDDTPPQQQELFSENVVQNQQRQEVATTQGTTEVTHTVEETGLTDTGETSLSETETEEIPQTQEETSLAQQPKKKMSLKAKICVAGIVLLAGAGGITTYNRISGSNVQDNIPIAYEYTGCYALDTFKELVRGYDKTGLEEYLGGTSFIAQEWDYTNSDELRQNFVKSVCSYFDIVYPEGSNMTENENCTITVVDFDKLSKTMEEDEETIREMYLKAGYNEKDYDFSYNMTNLMLDYLLQKGQLPTKNVEINIPLKSNAQANVDAEGKEVYVDTYVVQDDIAVDKALFSSDELHAMCDKFSTIAVKWQDTKKGKVESFVDNPKYKKWAEKLSKITKHYEDKGKKYPDTSKLYEYDKKTMKLKKDKKGNYIEVKKPDEKIVKVVNGEIDNPYLPETYIPYTWVGAYYCQYEYNGEGGIRASFGNGTQDAPAGIGTEIITKAIDIYGVAHDVKVSLTGYWVGSDAVDYAVSFSEKNRGLSGDSIVTLICYEVEIENLEDKDITIESDLCLVDRNGNQSSKTGSMFGFKSMSVIPAHQKVVLQDWATSTEMVKKYVVWGKSFSRQYDLVWFNLLAGDKSNSGKKDEDLQSDENGSAVTLQETPTEVPIVTDSPNVTDIPQDLSNADVTMTPEEQSTEMEQPIVTEDPMGNALDNVNGAIDNVTETLPEEQSASDLDSLQ